MHQFTIDARHSSALTFPFPTLALTSASLQAGGLTDLPDRLPVLVRHPQTGRAALAMLQGAHRDSAVVNARLQRALGLLADGATPTASPATIEVTIGQRLSLVSQLAIAGNMPDADEIEMDERHRRTLLASSTGIAPSTPWVILANSRHWVLVRVRFTHMNANGVRVHKLIRTLLGDGSRTEHTHEPLQVYQLPDANSRSITRASAGAARPHWFTRVARRMVMRCEAGLRWYLGAPVLLMRADIGLIGDDGPRIVRVAKEAMSVLCVTPGEQVLVSWGPRWCVGIIHEQVPAPNEPPPGAGTRAHVASDTERHASQVKGAPASAPDAVPAYLVAQVSAEIRHDLGAPTGAALVVRRRLVALFIRRINSFVLPVGGLLVSALALNDIGNRRWLLIPIGIVAILASLSPDRRKRAPRGCFAE